MQLPSWLVCFCIWSYDTMEFFSKLITKKRKLDVVDCKSRDRRRSDPRINPEQVRLLLFKECDWRGRKLLFDSSTIVKVPANEDDKPSPKHSETPYILEVDGGYSYLYKGPAPDEAILGEMIFGAVAMNHRGVSHKIHIMDDPKRLMCTKVFFVPAARRSSRVDRNASAVDQTDPSDDCCNSSPLSVPSFEALSLSFDRGDSGFFGEQSLHSSVSSTGDFFTMFDAWKGSVQSDLCVFQSLPGRKLSSSSASSWLRRSSRSMATKFELGSQTQSSNLLEVPTSATNFTSCDSQVLSNSSASSTSDSLASSNVTSQRRNKLGLALIITVTDPDDMVVIRHCVEHSSQLAALVCRVRLSILAATKFLPTLCGAVTMFATWLSDLMFGPRLQPMWLSIASQVGDGNKMADKLIQDVCSVLSLADTKHTNFFFSALLTQVLTHHLGWVTSVSPYDVLDPKNHLPDDASKTRPYNALWAQLNDLCGCIGFPPKATRTIIAGATSSLVHRLLAVLTYFLRCGEVRRKDFNFQNVLVQETKVTNLKSSDKTMSVFSAGNSSELIERSSSFGLKRTATKIGKLTDMNSNYVFEVPEIRTQDNFSDEMVSPSRKLVSNRTSSFNICDPPVKSSLRRIPTVVQSLEFEATSDVETKSDPKSELTQKVLFVLGDNEKLVGLKNKSSNGKKVKRSSKIHHEPLDLDNNRSEAQDDINSNVDENCKTSHNLETLDKENLSTDIPSYTQNPTDITENIILNTDIPIEPEPIQKSKITLQETKQLPVESIDKENKPNYKKLYENSYSKHKQTKVQENTKNHAKQLNDADIEKVTGKVEENATKTGDIVLNKDENIEKVEQNATKSRESPSKCCSQTLRHSQPIKHSGFKFEFDKYPQIVTNYMKSKNLEILNRHYIGKPGNLKLDNFQFDPMVVPQIQDEKCETCYKCLMMESILQTPTNASELEFMNDVPRPLEPQFATVKEVKESEAYRDISPKAFVPQRNPNTLVVNVSKSEEISKSQNDKENKKEKKIVIENVIEFSMPSVEDGMCNEEKCGFDGSLLGDVTDHYVPDLILQGTTSNPAEWQSALRRDLDLATYVNKSLVAPIHAVAIIGDTNVWEVRVVGRGGREGFGAGSTLVAAMLDALPHMCRAKVPPRQCLFFVESKLREFCILSKTLADMLMSTDFCDMETLTKTLNIDINDVPLLMAVATTHTPEMARRYGVSYR